MAANPHYAEGEVIANKYVVEGLLGESPAARIFLANGNAGKLGVKIYRPEISARLLAAPDFFLKASVATEIEHDNLAACVDVQEEMGMVFLARSHCEGLSFEDWARNNRNAGNYFSRGLELLWQACQGLTALHERTRHLNIHPGNVIVGPLTAKLVDWDPRALGNMEMTPDALPGRPEFLGYRAPEAAGRGAFLSYPSTDLFAVAGLLFRLIKGGHPSAHPAHNLAEIRTFEKEVSAFLVKAMHPKPEERFLDAGAFSDALWELQGAMARMQERNPPAAAPAAPEPSPIFRKPEPARPVAPALPSAPDPFADPPSRGDAGLAGAGGPAKAGDSFFDFFPTADPAPQPGAEHLPLQAKASGETLFGAPPIASQRTEPAPPRREPPPPPSPSYMPPRPVPEAPTPSGMSGLETPGTLFGSHAPLFQTPARPAPAKEPPAPPRPQAISLASLEKDPLELAAGEPSGGFTTYGFQGAGDNRTGIYAPEAKAASARTKLMILLGTAGALILLIGLTALFLFLRSNAADKDRNAAEAEAADPAYPESPAPEPPAPALSQAPTPSAAPMPEVPAVSQPETPPAPAAAVQEYSEPPMPVEPPRPGAEAGHAYPAPAGPAKTPVPAGGGSVPPEREAALMAMVKNQTWPASAAERLAAADDLNDLGRTAEANMAYAKALLAPGIGEKQQISAYGGLAVTFQAMGMREQARDAVQRILDINPRNAFALKMKEKLR